MNKTQRQAVSWCYENVKDETKYVYYLKDDVTVALRHLNTMAEMFGEQGRWSKRIVNGTDHWLSQGE